MNRTSSGGTIEPYRTIRQAQGNYPCYIAPGLLNDAGPIVARLLPGRRPFVVSTEVVRGLFGERLNRSFPPDTPWIVVPDGEIHKTLATAGTIVTELLKRGARRDAVVVVVGGGVVGDTAGFAASILLRGVPLVHVPTTLLAQVDSSIGGKVAVNHVSGKNLIGSFHAPAAVIDDTETLSTLPDHELLSGLFEALKGGVIGDIELFELLADSRKEVLSREAGLLNRIVQRSVTLKASIIEKDEREGDLRRLLNFGHTIGHGIEAAISFEGLTHGEAVAWGMIAANAIAVKRGLLPRAIALQIDQAVAGYAPRAIPPLDEVAAMRAITHDKKFTEGRQVMVLAREIGRCEIVSDITTEELRYGLSSVLT